jgi:large subunit ribosomal protein L6
MSRLGKKAVELPQGVTVTIEHNLAKVKGPKGELSYLIRPEITVKQENNFLVTTPKVDIKENYAYWGLTRALLASMVKGVSEGYEKSLELVGVGFRAKQVSPTNIVLTLGFSHPVDIKAPEGISFVVGENNIVSVKGINKELVGQVAANIRKIKKPEPYKGKGIRYVGEIVRRKAGKAGKTGAGAAK